MDYGDKVIDILENTKLNWTVEKEILFRGNGVKTNTYGLFRKDNDLQLNQVKNSYTVYQNFQLVEDLVDIVGNHLQIDNIESIRGGALQGGRKVFLQFPINQITIKNDIVKRFLTFINSHDGSTTIAMGSSNIVVSCSNTFFAAHRNMESQNRFKHSEGAILKLGALKKELTHALEEERTLIEQMQSLVNKEIHPRLIEDVKKIVTGPLVEDASTRMKNIHTGLENSINKELVAKGMDAWALFNGVTYYNTHVASKDSNYNTMFGGGSKSNAKVLEFLTLEQ